MKVWLFMSIRFLRTLLFVLITVLCATIVTTPICAAQTYSEPYTVSITPSSYQVSLSETAYVDVVVKDANGVPVNGAMIYLVDVSSVNNKNTPLGTQYTNVDGYTRYSLYYSLPEDAGDHTLKADCYLGDSFKAGSSTMITVYSSGSGESSMFSKLPLYLGALVGSGLVLVIFALLVIIAIIFIIWYLRRAPPAAQTLELLPGANAIQADGTSAVKITIRLKSGNKYLTLPEGQTINLQTTLGSISSPVIVPRGAGSATAVLIAGTTDGVAEITATSGKARGQCNVTLKGMAKRFCMHCGAQMSANAPQCPRCGMAPPSGVDVRACVNCGTVIPELAKFCHKCGAAQPEVKK